jgi:hypothetical protein
MATHSERTVLWAAVRRFRQEGTGRCGPATILLLVALSACCPLAALADAGLPTPDATGRTQSLSERIAGQLDSKSVQVKAVPDGAELRCDLQKLKGRVTADGLTIESLSESEGRGAFTLRLAGWGRVGPLSASDRDERERSRVLLSPGPGQVTVAGNRVTLVRSTAFRACRFNATPATGGAPHWHSLVASWPSAANERHLQPVWQTHSAALPVKSTGPEAGTLTCVVRLVRCRCRDIRDDMGLGSGCWALGVGY